MCSNTVRSGTQTSLQTLCIRPFPFVCGGPFALAGPLGHVGCCSGTALTHTYVLEGNQLRSQGSCNLNKHALGIFIMITEYITYILIAETPVYLCSSPNKKKKRASSEESCG